MNVQSLTPGTLGELARDLSRLTEKSKVIAGGTDYIIQARRAGTPPDMLLYPGRIPELREITFTPTQLRIGAMVTMNALSKALSPYPEFCAIADAASNVGSPQIRAKATIGGNLCNASPAGDMLPVCRLFSAAVEVLDASGQCTALPLEQFVLGPRRTALAPAQIITAIVIPRSASARCVSAFYKIGFRDRVSISRESLGARVCLAEDGAVLEAQLSVGAVAPTPLLVPEAAALLVGKPLCAETTALLAPLIAETIHNNCRPTNRLYKTESARGLCADLFDALAARSALV